MPPDPIAVPDTESRSLLGALPAAIRPWLLLGRFDRPIGAWLLYWPGAWAIALTGGVIDRWDLLLWFALGAIAMRAAGCVYNDIVDRDLDVRVARTRDRPLASGRIGLKGAWAYLLVLCLIGLIVLFQLNPVAQITAFASIAPVAAYPFMKRITWWPQAWLGLVFSWAALVGWAAVTGGFAWPLGALYAGSILWVIGYDTIYALQDIEDDALAGVRSSARALGSRARLGIALFYIATLVAFAFALWLVRQDVLALAALIPFAIHLAWQVATLDPADPANALHRFRSNRFAGMLMFLACLVASAGL
ncbi:4-hydroxybenzoate octaprenyltransferase [Sphingomonas sp. ID0503]|uniref:4-hydroxybenzoate octaprenyltransferase n=1 Tax=Sphingomonas sp. ID0503 TaxID=3399691 RepID=UPI003AFB78C1